MGVFTNWLIWNRIEKKHRLSLEQKEAMKKAIPNDKQFKEMITQLNTMIDED